MWVKINADTALNYSNVYKTEIKSTGGKFEIEFAFIGGDL